MTEQFKSGVGSMEAMEMAQLKAPVTDKEIQIEKLKLIQIENTAIANAERIDGGHEQVIKNKLDRQEYVTDDERNSLKRLNLMDCYHISDLENITEEFVKVYNVKQVKNAYRNRHKLITEGIEYIIKNDENHFDRDVYDRGATADDLKRKYLSKKMCMALDLLKLCGFDSIIDVKEIKKTDLLKSLMEEKQNLIDGMDEKCKILCRSKRHKPKIEEWPEKTYLKNVLQFMNSILIETFGISIKQTGNRSEVFKLKGIDTYDFKDFVRTRHATSSSYDYVSDEEEGDPIDFTTPQEL